MWTVLKEHHRAHRKVIGMATVIIRNMLHYPAVVKETGIKTKIDTSLWRGNLRVRSASASDYEIVCVDVKVTFSIFVLPS